MGSIQHKTPILFRERPLFGMDIGKGSLKVVQLSSTADSKPKLVGYGATSFNPEAIVDGVIVKPEIIAKAAHDLFSKKLIGDIKTDRVSFTIPSYRTFTRSVQLPLLKPKELADAVRLEAEEYIPAAIDELHIDYTVISKTADTQEVLIVAVPQDIVSSYVTLGSIMGLETVALETTMSAVGRLFAADTFSDIPTVIIDFGSQSSDISIYDRGIVTTGTVAGGGEIFTNTIKQKLDVTDAEAAIIKTKYGLTKSRRQAEIKAALDPTLTQIVREIKRLIRYHSERYGADRPIEQVVTLGGGANVPGLSDYLTNSLRVAVRLCDPWEYVDHNNLQAPHYVERTMYASTVGLAMLKPDEVFA